MFVGINTDDCQPNINTCLSEVSFIVIRYLHTCPLVIILHIHVTRTWMYENQSQLLTYNYVCTVIL